MFIPTERRDKSGTMSTSWIVSRQPRRRESKLGTGPSGAQELIVVFYGIWKLWDGRVWLKVTKMEKEDEMTLYLRGRGPYSEPIIERIVGSKKETIWSLASSGAAAGTFKGSNMIIEWRCTL